MAAWKNKKITVNVLLSFPHQIQIHSTLFPTETGSLSTKTLLSPLKISLFSLYKHFGITIVEKKLLITRQQTHTDVCAHTENQSPSLPHHFEAFLFFWKFLTWTGSCIIIFYLFTQLTTSNCNISKHLPAILKFTYGIFIFKIGKNLLFYCGW